MRRERLKLDQRERTWLPAQHTPKESLMAPRPTATSTAATATGAQPTSIEEIRRRRAEGDVYRLPGSGIQVRLKRPNYTRMAVSGSLSNPYVTTVLKWINARTDRSEQLDEEQRHAAYIRNGKAFFANAANCMPDFDPEGKDPNKIWPEDLADRDLTWLFFDFAEGEDADVAEFRVTGSAGTPGPAGETLPDAA